MNKLMVKKLLKEKTIYLQIIPVVEVSIKDQLTLMLPSVQNLDKTHGYF